MADDFLKRFKRLVGEVQRPQTSSPASEVTDPSRPQTSSAGFAGASPASGGGENTPFPPPHLWGGGGQRPPEGSEIRRPPPASDSVSTPLGHVRVIETRLRHPDLLTDSVVANAARIKDARVRGFSKAGALFLDIEATGLSHGAGTVAFLLGLGRVDGDDFVVEQILLEDYNEEPAQLLLLLERLSASTHLVSYNGKSYDTSVLESRLVMNRLMDREEAHLKLMPHLDLLHLGRRLHAGTLENYTLSSMERGVLDHRRIDDLPGELVPQHYFQYLVSRDPVHLEPVLRHNLQDVVSLALLAHSFLQLLDPAETPPSARIEYNVAREIVQTGDFQRARVLLADALRSVVGPMPVPVAAREHPWAALIQCLPEPGPSLRLCQRQDLVPEPWVVDATALLCRAIRRTGGTWEEELDAWETVQHVGGGNRRVHLEMSKIYEHKAKDLNRAIREADTALLCGPPSPEIEARIERLKKRLMG